MVKTAETPAVEKSQAERALAPRPAALFQGVDSVNGHGFGTAVEGSSVKTGGTSAVEFVVAEDTESICKALDVTQSASVGFGPLGSVSDKTHFIQTLNLTKHSVNIVVRAKHVQGTRTATQFALMSDVARPVGDDALREFFRCYGDSFVSAMTMGSEYYAAYTFYAESSDERNSVVADLEANGVSDFGTVSADLQTKIDNVVKNTKTRIAFSQDVAGLANPQLPTPEKLIQYALKFPSIGIDAPVILSYDWTGYEHVRGVGDFEPLARNRDCLVGSGPVEGLASNLVRLGELNNQIDWLQGLYRFYGDFQDHELNNASLQVRDDIDVVTQQFKQFKDDPIASPTQPSLLSLELGTPLLNYKPATARSYGGSGGGPFSDVDPLTFLQRQTRISEIQLRSGKYVNQLHVTYLNDAGSHEGVHGGEGGTLSNVLKLQEGEFVTEMSGRSGRLVDQLHLTTNRNNSVSGGGKGGGAFKWTVPSDAVVLGFEGRSGKDLDNITVVYASLLPAKWVHN